MAIIKISPLQRLQISVWGNIFKQKKMKKAIVVLVCILNLNLCYSQEMIFFQDGAVKVVKVKDIGGDKIKYKIYEEFNSPLYETDKRDILKVIDVNGNLEFFLGIRDSIKPIKYNPSHSSTLYILYNYKNDNGTRFPLYINDTYICTLQNHSRLKYILHSGGRLQIQRKSTHSYKDGPVINLSVEPGKSYGINLLLMYPQALDPNKKFKYDIIVDSVELSRFLNNQFYGFKPFKSDDFMFEEDERNPLFK